MVAAGNSLLFSSLSRRCCAAKFTLRVYTTISVWGFFVPAKILPIVATIISQACLPRASDYLLYTNLQAAIDLHVPALNLLFVAMSILLKCWGWPMQGLRRILL